jgi:hypothetical protein
MSHINANTLLAFEDKSLSEFVVVAVEKVVQHEDMSIAPMYEKTGAQTQSEQVEEAKMAPSKV